MLPMVAPRTARKVRFSSPALPARASVIAECFSCCAPIPKLETSLEGIRIVSEPRLLRQAPQFLGVSTAEHDVVRLQRRDEVLDDVSDLLPPFLLAKTLQAGCSQIILERAALAIVQVAKLHRLRNPVDDHRRSEAGA